MHPILVVDDEQAIAMLIRRILTDAGYRCEAVTDSIKAADLLEKKQYDLVLLDIMMPQIDGYDLLNYIRPTGTPCIFITAKAAVEDRVRGLHSGADDYIVKPFDLDELGARIAAHLRREQRRQNNSAVRFFGELILDYSARTVTINNLNIPLSKREFEIVELLSLNAGQVFDRERIYELVWGLDGDGNSDTIMEHIRKIRAKFAAHTLHNYIETVWGCGYRWNA